MSDKQHWKERIGLKSESVLFYLPKDNLNELTNEAEDLGITRSRYIRQLISEAQRLRRGELEYRGDKAHDTYKLLNRIKELEIELESEKKRKGVFIKLESVIDDAVYDLLGDNPIPLEDAVFKFMEGGWAIELITRPVEDSLYRLFDKGKVTYIPKKGWKKQGRGD